MSDLVDPDQIEAIVGVPRDHHQHWGKAVSAEGRVYILHSMVCLGLYEDLRQCPFSLALDDGIDIADWTEDVPVVLALDEQDDRTWLMPKET